MAYTANQIASYINTKIREDLAYPTGAKATEDTVTYPSGYTPNTYVVILVGQRLTLPAYESDGVTPWTIDSGVVFRNIRMQPVLVTQEGNAV